MDIVIVILLIGLSIWSSYNKQKKRQQQEAAQRAAAARAASEAGEAPAPQAPPALPRWYPEGPGPFSGPSFPFPGQPAAPANTPAPQPQPAADTGAPLPGALSGDGEGEPEEPENPELWRRRALAEQKRAQWEAGQGGEGEDEPGGGVEEAEATVREHLRATAGRNETATDRDDTHTERSMGGGVKAPASVPAPAGTAPHAAAILPCKLRFDKNAVAQGVLMSEILGRPKALRRR